MSTEPLTPEQKAKIISDIISQYDEEIIEITHDLFVTEYQEALQDLYVKIYDQHIK